MPHTKERFLALTLLFSSVAAFTQTEPLVKSAAVKAGVRHNNKTKPPAGEQVPTPEPVPIQEMTPEELPAMAPQVSYNGGVLTVEATNATLGDILNAIRMQTGAKIETPPVGSAERVAVHLSGTPSVVIPALLDGSKYGYLIRTSPEDPTGVLEVVLHNKPTGASQPIPQSTSMAMSAAARPSGVPQRIPTSTEVADNTPLGMPSDSAPPSSGQPTSQPIVSMNEPDKTSDQTEQPAQPDHANLSASIDDPHPPPPVQLTANQQNPDQAQQQQDTNRQFMQDLYRSRQKLQPQPDQPIP